MKIRLRNIKKLLSQLPLPFWVSFYIFLLLITLPVLAYIGNFGGAAPGTLTVTIDQKSGTNDPNPSYTSVFTVQFSEAIDRATFTDADITLAGTAPGQSVQSITEAGSFDQTTYEVRIQAISAGTITPSIAQELITAQNGGSGTNQASTSTDNSVTYNGDWAPGEFVTTWKTDNPGVTSDTQIQIPTSVGTYNYTVDWGDGNVDTGQTGSTTHTYASAGTYTVKISGTFPRIRFNNTGDRQKILTVEQWGINPWVSMAQAFSGASNLQVPAIDGPNFDLNVYLDSCFSGATSLNSNINHWEVNTAISMIGVFTNASSFNQPLSEWDVSNVGEMEAMFRGATVFNQPLNNWDTDSLIDTSFMFADARAFNQPLDNWNTASVFTMSAMFANAISFNQSIDSWNTSSVGNMAYMFASASVFNQPLNSLNVSNVTDMRGMFGSTFGGGFGTLPDYSTVFNQPLNNWNVGNVTRFDGMFNGNTAFNQAINSWNTSSATNTSYMFFNASTFNQPLSSWDVSGVTNMEAMFAGATAFNRSLGTWDVSAVTNMQFMFANGSGLSTANYDATLIDWSALTLQSSVNFSAGTSTYCDATTERQAIITSYSWSINDSGLDCTPPTSDPFIFRVKTDNPGDNLSTEFRIPTGSYTYDYNVDCDNDGTPEHINQTGDVTCSYGSAGEYNIAISGTFPHFDGLYEGNQQKIIDVIQWGDIEWQNMSGMFYGALNISVLSATDVPNLSSVTDLSSMFAGASSFNTDISNWDVSNVTNLSQFLENASNYNQPLNSWDVSNVTDMRQVFDNALVFNQPLNNWDVSSAADMAGMFYKAYDFNQNINGWNVSSVTNMEGMFNEALDYDQPLNNWDVGSVTSMENMFANAASFNQSLSSWDVSSVTEMTYMFTGAILFNQDINNWNVSNVSNFEGMFQSALSFDQPLDNWDVSGAVQLAAMFQEATSFDQPLNNWNVSNVTNMQTIFAGASSFNQPLNNWNVSNVTNMMGMFAAVPNFDHSLADWDVSNVADMTFMFGDGDGFFPVSSGLSTPNYDATLIAWSAQNLEGFVIFDAGTSTYCNAEAQRQSIIDDKFWTINDSGKACSEAVVTTKPATNVTSDSAVLNGTTSPTGVIERGFQYGTDTNYGQTTQDASALEYTYTLHWGSAGSADGQFVQPPSMAVDSLGNVYVADSGNDRIQKFNSNGDFITKWGIEGAGNGELNNPTGITIDSEDNVYVVDRSNHRIQKFDSSGNYLTQWGTQGTANGQFDSPFGITADSQDNLYVTDVSNERVQKFDSTGTYLITIGSEGSGNGQFEDPYGIAVDSEDNLYVTDINNPTTRIQKFDPTGAYILQWGTPGSGSGQFNYPIQVAVNAAGDVYVSDLLNNRIQKFDSNGVFESIFASNGTGDGQVQQPSGIAFNNAEDTLYVISSGSGKLQQFTVKITANVSSLACETTYHYRAYATDGNTTAYGDDEAFTTGDCPPEPFIMRVKTDNPGVTAANEFLIFTNNGPYTYNYSVDCNNDGTPEFTNQTDNITCSYGSPGEYDIAISGDFPYLARNFFDPRKMIDIKQWGDIEWQSMFQTFQQASNVQISATDSPNLSSVVDMTDMFNGASSFNSNIDDWDVSNVEEMSGLFNGASSFNQPLNSWDVSSVINMSNMFRSASAFNQPLNNWNTSSVIDMSFMFFNASEFNQNINSWDVSSVVSMHYLFNVAESFNQPLNNWDVSSVQDMSSMFAGADSFNQPLNNWNVSNVVDMSSMFSGAEQFNQNINSWDISSVENISWMFSSAESFNQPLNNWNVSNIVDITGMFLGASSFNQPLNNWDVSNITNMVGLFAAASSFNQSLADWDVSNVVVMAAMFGDYGGFFSETSGLSTPNYDATLIAWSAQDLEGNVLFDAGTSKYCFSEAQRQSIIDTKFWTINDNGTDCNTDPPELTLAGTFVDSQGNPLSQYSVGDRWYFKLTYPIKEGAVYQVGLTVLVNKITRQLGSIDRIYGGDPKDDFRDRTTEWNTNSSSDLPWRQTGIYTRALPQEVEDSYDVALYIGQLSGIASQAGTGELGVQIKIETNRDPNEWGVTTNNANNTVQIISPSNPDDPEPDTANPDAGNDTTPPEENPTTDPQTDNPPTDTFIPNQNQTNESQPASRLSPAILNIPVLGSVINSLVGLSETVPVPVARSIPWTLLLLLVALSLYYLYMAYLEEERRKALRGLINRFKSTQSARASYLDITSHYVNTPLSVMQGTVQVLASTKAINEELTMAATTQLNKLSKQVQSLLAQAQQTSIGQSAVVASLERTTITSIIGKPYVWVPLAVSYSLALLANVVFIQADKYEPSTITVVAQVGIAIVGMLAIVSSVYYWQRMKHAKKLVADELELEKQYAYQQAEFIGSAYESLSADLTALNVLGKTIVEQPKGAPFAEGLTKLEQTLFKLETVGQLARNVPGQSWRTDVNQAIEAALTEARQAADAKQVSITTQVEPHLMASIGEAGLVHVIRAPLMNAIQFSSPGSQVEFTAVPADNGIVITTTDHGSGMDKTTQAKLFQPFSRSATEQFNYEGLGLDLYLTRVILEQYGGTIAVTSRVGEGTRVTVKLTQTQQAVNNKK